ncbi:MAG TPA: TetR/AcrR family transcriptional regulator [Sphingobium sp.]|uniref:TetR/AcrR family transcriptional regulator n=1 Tax=Sphingobium sp. TaxID=1912891 RepID=UPI002ED221D4
MGRIVRAAEEEFKIAGYSGATTAAIARRADVTEAQLFRYFASKADLFREAIFTPLNQHFTDFLASQLADADNVVSQRERARQYITELQSFLSDHSQMLMSLVVAQTYAPDTTQGVGSIDSLRAYFDRGAATMSGRIQGEARVNPKLMVRVSFAAVLACVMFKDWIFPSGLAGEGEINDAIIDFVIDGINANSD